MNNNMNGLFSTLFFILMISFSSAATINLNKKSLATGTQFEADYFLGDWKTWGYTCDNQTPVNELVNITYENNNISAKKTLGDNCVTTGFVTFKGPTLPSYTSGQDISVTYTLGSQYSPNSSYRGTSIQIQDINNFKHMSWGLRYERTSPYPLQAKVVVPVVTTGVWIPSTYFKGQWTAKGATCDNLTGIQSDVSLTFIDEMMTAKVNDEFVFGGYIADQSYNLSYDQSLPVRINNPDFRNSTAAVTFSTIKILQEDVFKVDAWNVIFVRKH